MEDKEAVNTTQAGLDSLGRTASLSVKNVPLRQVITLLQVSVPMRPVMFCVGEARMPKGLLMWQVLSLRDFHLHRLLQ